MSKTTTKKGIKLTATEIGYTATINGITVDFYRAGYCRKTWLHSYTAIDENGAKLHRGAPKPNLRSAVDAAKMTTAHGVKHLGFQGTLDAPASSKGN